MGCCAKTLHTLILLITSTLYLLLGLAIVIGSAATFFTKYGDIITPLYAASSLGGGLVILGVSVIGFKAACSRKKCMLGTFMVLDVLILVGAVASSALMFEYERVLNIAAESNLDDDVTHGIATLSKARANVVRTVVDNAFEACDGKTTYNAGPPGVFEFTCQDTQFSFLGNNVQGCLADGVNATAGSTFDECYNSPYWVETPALVNPPDPNQNLLAVLNRPKGIFCACSATIVNKLLDNFRYAKYVAVGVCVFLFLVFISCCYLCCCAKAVPEESQQAELTPVGPGRGWSAGGSVGSAPIQTKQKRGASRNDGAYLARP